MAGKKFIPNEWSWIAFLPGTEAWDDMKTVTAEEVASAVPLTQLCVSLNASAQGNTVPTPTLDTLWESTIRGTSQGTFTADFYRLDERADDLAWATLPRGTVGTFLICRYGVEKGETPEVGADIEKWPVDISARTASNMSSNTAQTFTCTAGVPVEPLEDGTVSSG